MCNFYKLEEAANYWQSVLDINNWQKSRISKIVVNYLFGNISGKKIAILGFAFKANTNDTRQSPCIDICSDLLDEGAHLSIYDPKVENYKIKKDLENKNTNLTNETYGGSLEICSSAREASMKSDAIVVLTEWEEFYSLDWHDLFQIMRKPSWIFDTRSCIDHKKAINAGFNIWQVGNSPRINK